MRFIEGAPTFAVEVRSDNDYGAAAEAEMAAKRADYFEAGTQIVWDVDPIAETIRVYRAGGDVRPRPSFEGKRPMPSRSWRAGGLEWTGSSPEHA